VTQIKQNLKVAQNRQKSYADQKRTPREFKTGDHVYLRVRPRKSSLKMGACAKLAPRYCGPFEVLDRVGPVAYRLALPPTVKAHNVFHVSLLKKYVHDANHIIDCVTPCFPQSVKITILAKYCGKLRNVNV
jgi:hypothetical protein